jgi:hypothetical protein
MELLVSLLRVLKRRTSRCCSEDFTCLYHISQLTFLILHLIFMNSTVHTHILRVESHLEV